MPALDMDHLLRWKKFLDSQDQLTHLIVNFELVHWKFFSTVLEKNIRNLKSLDLVLTNWYQQNDARDYIPPEIPMMHWFDWNLIAPMAKRLKSLCIKSIPEEFHSCQTFSAFTEDGCRIWPIRTLNFDLLTSLLSVETLFLKGVLLDKPVLRIILTGMPSLRDVELVNFTLFQDVDPNHPTTQEINTRSRTLCNLFRAAMELNQFVRIRLFDCSLTVCTAEDRNRVLSQGRDTYSVIWKTGIDEEYYKNISTSMHDYYEYPYPLLIQRKVSVPDPDSWMCRLGSSFLHYLK